MKRVLIAAAALALVLQPVATEAQLLVPGPTPANQEYQTFVSGSGQGGAYGVQVGPYTSTFASTPSNFSVICVDFLHSASRSTGLVNTTRVVSGGNFANTRLGNFAQYQRAAYLSSLFDSWTTHQTVLGGGFSQGNVWGGLHAAIWSGTSGASGSLSANATAAMAYFNTLADQNAASFNSSAWYVLSEADVSLDSQYSGQEFLMLTRNERSVPEPGTILLMITGLLLMVGANRRRLAELY